MRCTIRFDASNPDMGDGYCLYCIEELRYPPGELAHLRAEGRASELIDHEHHKHGRRRAHHKGAHARPLAGAALPSGGDWLNA